MSLARNPNMPYVTAGRQKSPYERMNVRSHVYVPDADAHADYDGRPTYTAPVKARHEAMRISMKTVIVAVTVALFILGMLYISALSKRAGIYKEGQSIYNEIQTLDREIIVLKEQIAKAQEPNSLRYEASQRLGMINSEGKEPIEIYAPETRPGTAVHSLAAGQERALQHP